MASIPTECGFNMNNVRDTYNMATKILHDMLMS